MQDREENIELDEVKLARALLIADNLDENIGIQSEKTKPDNSQTETPQKTEQQAEENGREAEQQAEENGREAEQQTEENDQEELQQAEEEDIFQEEAYVVHNIKSKKIVWKLVFLVSFLLFAAAASYMAFYVVCIKRNKEEMERLRSTTESQYEYDPEDRVGVVNPVDFDALTEECQDIYAWIKVPGTDIDYPIVQNETDNGYYLNHDITGSYNIEGAIYSENYNTKTFEDFDTVIYGHNMRNGSMFRTLHNYEKVNFAENHRYIYIYTPDAILTYRIFAVYKGDAGHILLEYDFSDNRVKENYISTICASGENYGILYDDVDISTESKILTLSTCTGEDDSRFIVQAVQIDSIPAK